MLRMGKQWPSWKQVGSNCSNLIDVVKHVKHVKHHSFSVSRFLKALIILKILQGTGMEVAWVSDAELQVLRLRCVQRSARA